MAAAAGPPPHGHPHPHHPHVRPSPIGPFSEDKTHKDPERWICIYPAYLNAAKTRAEGRHIAKKDCVVNPTYLEIRDVLATAGLAPIVENKKHPRERSNEIEFRGRIRVQLKNEDGTPFKEEFKTREDVLKHLGQMIPQLKSRTSKQGQSQDGAHGGGGGGGGAGGGAKKKGKKK